MTLQIPIGITDSGDMLEQDLGLIRHLLITGKTGAGKSVLLKSILKSIDNQSCKIILIDTKGGDFDSFTSTRLMCPVITDAKMAVNYLKRMGKTQDNLVIIIDELSDLIAVSGDIQKLLITLSEIPHIHIVMATRMMSILSDDFRQQFQNHVLFTDGKIGDITYNQTHIKTINYPKEYKMNKMFTKSWFDNLEAELRARGLDSDDKSFDEIKANLINRKIFSPDEFASTAIYVVMAGGFRQTTAKKCHRKLMEILPTNQNPTDLSKVYGNKRKIKSIKYIWENREGLCNGYYKCEMLDEKIKYLLTLPHIGPITVTHLTRNLGENTVKYDIWIQRLGAVYSRKSAMHEKINNAKLHPDIKKVCDDMFAHLEQETGLPRGYIDAVLFKSCQNYLIDVKQ